MTGTAVKVVKNFLPIGEQQEVRSKSVFVHHNRNLNNIPDSSINIELSLQIREIVATLSPEERVAIVSKFDLSKCPVDTIQLTEDEIERYALSALRKLKQALCSEVCENCTGKICRA